MESDFDRLRQTYYVYEAARINHEALMKAAIAGEPISREDLMGSAEAVQSAHAEFMKAGESIIRWKR